MVVVARFWFRRTDGTKNIYYLQSGIYGTTEIFLPRNENFLLYRVYKKVDNFEMALNLAKRLEV